MTVLSLVVCRVLWREVVVRGRGLASPISALLYAIREKNIHEEEMTVLCFGEPVNGCPTL